MKIGVFGGTFNPIHTAHIYLAREYIRQLALDRLVLAPAYTPPHKSAEGLASAADRLAMCRLATKELPLAHVTEYESRQGGKSYTYLTLRYLEEKYPGSELFLIMGGDMFFTVQDWRRAADIYATATLCTARRKREELTALDRHKACLEQQGARCIVIDAEAKPMSSTQVRELIQKGENPSGLLHPDVWDYIQRHGLYRQEV